MHPSSPSDLIWEALTLLVQQLEALGQVLEICAFYLPWCGIGVAGLALLLLTGLVLVELRSEREEAASFPFADGNGPT